MAIAFTRVPSPKLAECALTFLDRVPIDAGLAARQHSEYEQCLRRLGLEVVHLPALPDQPDGVFVEDTAVVLDDVAVIARPLSESRRREVETVAAALTRHRPLERVQGPATLEGGDVIRIGRTVYVGLSRRTSPEGCEQLRALLMPRGFTVRSVRFTGCLHLKTACSYIGDGTLLANRAWVDCSQVDDAAVIDVPDQEPHAANALRVGDTILLAASFPRTRSLLERQGFRTESVDVSELQKAEAGLTCCSLILD